LLSYEEVNFLKDYPFLLYPFLWSLNIVLFYP